MSVIVKVWTATTGEEDDGLILSVDADSAEVGLSGVLHVEMDDGDLYFSPMYWGRVDIEPNESDE